jgi:hypothetical protein
MAGKAKQVVGRFGSEDGAMTMKLARPTISRGQGRNADGAGHHLAWRERFGREAVKTLAAYIAGFDRETARCGGSFKQYRPMQCETRVLSSFNGLPLSHVSGVAECGGDGLPISAQIPHRPRRTERSSGSTLAGRGLRSRTGAVNSNVGVKVAFAPILWKRERVIVPSGGTLR